VKQRNWHPWKWTLSSSHPQSGYEVWTELPPNQVISQLCVTENRCPGLWGEGCFAWCRIFFSHRQAGRRVGHTWSQQDLCPEAGAGSRLRLGKWGWAWIEMKVKRRNGCVQWWRWVGNKRGRADLENRGSESKRFRFQTFSLVLPHQFIANSLNIRFSVRFSRQRELWLGTIIC
jgi:hypothetical protein